MSRDFSRRAPRERDGRRRRLVAFAVAAVGLICGVVPVAAKLAQGTVVPSLFRGAISCRGMPIFGRTCPYLEEAQNIAKFKANRMVK